MRGLEVLLVASGFIPLAWAWRAKAGTPLAHTVVWAWAAWAGWATVATVVAPGPLATLRYLALSVTSCVGIAVLGARRPIAGPWNFVLLGLLAVLLLPFAENAVLGTPLLDPLRLIFISGTLAVGVLNYLPTRLAPAVLIAGLGVGLEVAALALDPADQPPRWLGSLCRTSALWLGCWLASVPRVGSAFDRQWLVFRNAFGLFWGQRVREQFNQAAVHAGWPVTLRWSGLRATEAIGADTAQAQLETLQALLKRFGWSQAGD